MRRDVAGRRLGGRIPSLVVDPVEVLILPRVLVLIIGGSLGAQQLDAKGINALATMPSLDQLRGKILGMLQTPATRIAGVLQAPGAQLARVFAAYGKTG